MGSVKFNLKSSLNKNQWYALASIFCAVLYSRDIYRLWVLVDNPVTEYYWFNFTFYVLMSTLWSFASFRYFKLIKPTKNKRAKITVTTIIKQMTEEEKIELMKELREEHENQKKSDDSFWTQAKEDSADLQEMGKVKDEESIAWDEFEKGLDEPEKVEQTEDEKSFLERLEADDRWDTRELGASEQHVRRVDKETEASFELQSKLK